jgi:TolA-binding protein
MRLTRIALLLMPLLSVVPLRVLAQAPPPKLELTEEQRKAEEAFSLADGLFRKGFHDQALEKFLAFVQQYPQHANASLALFLAGECNYAQSKYADAIPLYQRVLTEYPNSKDVDVAAYRIGHCKYQLKDYAGAIAAFEDLLKRVPDTQYKASALYWTGECHYSLGQHADAVKAYEQSITLAPQGEVAAWAAYSIGMSQLALGNPDAALQSFQRVARDYADSPVAAECELRVGDALREAGKPDEAVRSYEAVLKRGDAKLAPGALHGLAWCQFDAKQWTQARELFQRLLKEYADSPFAPSARRGLADCLYHEKQYPEAAKAYEEALNGAAPEAVPDLLFWQAASFEQAGDAARAKALYKRVVDEHAGHPLAAKAALRLAETSAEGQDLDSAEASYKEAAASNDPELKARGRLGLAWVAYQRGDKAGALKQYDEIARADPASATGGTAAIQGAQIAFAEKDYAKTIDLASLFLDRQPDADERPRARCLRGLSLAATDKTDEAVKELEQAVAAAPKADFTLNALTTLAQLYRKLGNNAKADEALARLKRDFPESAAGAEAEYDAATALFGAGKFAEARQGYEAVLKANEPSIAAPAQYQIGAAYFQEGQPEQALAAFRKVVEQYPTAEAAGPAQHQVGVCLLRLEKWPEAADALSKFIADHPNDEAVAEANGQLAWAYKNAGELDRAKALYEALVGRTASSDTSNAAVADALFQLGEIAYAAKDYETALARYSAIPEKQPNSDLIDEAQYMRGWSLLQLKRTDEAVEAFRACLAAKPEARLAADCHFQIGAALAAKGETDAAIAELQGFLTEYKSERAAPFALLTLADLYTAKEDWAKAEGALSASPTEGDDAYLARRSLLLGSTLRHLNRAADALPLLEKAVALSSGNTAARARFELAAAQSAAGKHAEAADGFLNVAILHGDSSYAAHALYEAGHSFEAAGKPDEAKKAYESLLKDYPNAAEWIEKAKARLQALGT